VCGDGLDAARGAARPVLRKSAGSFSTLRRPHERAAPGAAAVAGVGVLGDHAIRAAGAAGGSAAWGGGADRVDDRGGARRAGPARRAGAVAARAGWGVLRTRHSFVRAAPRFRPSVYR